VELCDKGLDPNTRKPNNISSFYLSFESFFFQTMQAIEFFFFLVMISVYSLDEFLNGGEYNEIRSS